MHDIKKSSPFAIAKKVTDQKISSHRIHKHKVAAPGTRNTQWSRTLQSHHIHVHEVAMYLKFFHTDLSCYGSLKCGQIDKRATSDTGIQQHMDS